MSYGKHQPVLETIDDATCNACGKDVEDERYHTLDIVLRPREEDPVNTPSHYRSSPARCKCGEPIECIQITEHMGFNDGNAMKYIWRYPYKNGIEDLKKARWYLDREIARLEKGAI